MFNKQNIKKFIFLSLVLVFSFFVYLFIRVTVHSNGVCRDLVVEDGNETTVPVTNDMVVEYNIVSQDDRIRSLLVKFSLEKLPDTGYITTNIIDAQSGSVISSSTVGRDFFDTESGYIVFDYADTVTGVAGKNLKFQITFQDFVDNQVSMFLSPAGEPILKLVTAGKDAYCTLVDVIYILYIVILAIVYAITLFFKNFKLENVYLIAVIGLGLIMSVMITMMVAPDEFTHNYIAYNISNKMMGVDLSANGTLMMRYDDFHTYYEPIYIGRDYYVYYFENFFNGLGNGELIDTAVKPAGAPFFLYLFSGLGITVGRLLGLGTTLTFMLGRWFNVLFFAFATYYAMKKMPFAKSVVFVWGLLPIVLQQISSYSYDCVIYGLCAMTIALTLKLMYGKESQTKRQKITDIVALIIFALLIVPCKGHAIIPVSLFPLMLVVKLIWDNRAKIKDYLNKKKARKIILISVTSVIAVLGVLAVGIILKGMLANADAQGDYIEWADQYARTMGYYIKNPVGFATMFINTLWAQGEYLFFQMFGGYLGWLEIDLPIIFIVPFLLLFLYAGIRREDEDQPIGVCSKLWMWVVFFGICFLACLGMLLYWTPASSGIILGVQGRYFLPALILPAVSLRTKSGCVSKNADKIIVYGTLLAHIFILTALFKDPL
ncbi:MAG: DUF2142 domain-containing protein [Lachnospiraceae bacterium]|nr:DUF2142 domain-containing protein [Lachnospiraceae bacterium]